MNISLTGNLGAGKSTICKQLEAKGFGIISGGTLFREVAKEKNMSVVELNEYVQENLKKGIRDVDDMIDQRTTKLNRELNHQVFDSRLAWHFAEGSFKVFLTANINETARRVFADNRETENYASLEECKESLLKRQRLEQERFRELYQINYYDMSNYDLVIETTNATPEAITEEILAAFEKYQKEKMSGRVLLNPTSVYPTNNPAAETDGEEVKVGLINNEWYTVAGQKKVADLVERKVSFVEVTVEGAGENLLQF